MNTGGGDIMANLAGLREISLAHRHIDDACALVAEAGWNETPDDWRLMIAHGDAIGFEDGTGRLIAAALGLPYGRQFGWISMVLVTAARRRRGLATYLLDACIAGHEAAGRVPVLDATPAGEKVYIGLGFKHHFTIQRWQCPHPGTPDSDNGGIRPIAAADIGQIIDFDRAIFGGDRAAILRDIATRSGTLGWVRTDGSGYLMSRAGRLARQLGPLCAEHDDAARALVAAALAHIDEPLFIDVPDHHTGLIEMLSQRGFTAQRPFTRMLKGKPPGFGDPARIYALAGPELG